VKFFKFQFNLILSVCVKLKVISEHEYLALSLLMIDVSGPRRADKLTKSRPIFILSVI